MRGSRFSIISLDKRVGTTSEIEVDGIVAGIGALPNVDLAWAAGLTVDNGRVVDPFLRTSHPDVLRRGDTPLLAVSAWVNAAASNTKTAP